MKHQGLQAWGLIELDSRVGQEGSQRNTALIKTPIRMMPPTPLATPTIRGPVKWLKMSRTSGHEGAATIGVDE
jgi:hypothetical protein